MKLKLTLFVITFFILSGCINENCKQNQFSSESDTLIIYTKPFPGKGSTKQSRSIHDLRFEDSIEYDVTYPESITKVKLAREIIDYNVWGFKRIISEGGKRSKYYPYYERLIENNRLDTLNIPSIKDNSVCFLKGELNEEEIFIVDENFNKDFSDDIIRIAKVMNTSSIDELIKCDFQIFNGKEYVIQTNWINAGKWKFGGDELYYLTVQHHTADFKIDNSVYQLEYYLNDSRFNFEEPTIAIMKANEAVKDTITDRDLLQIGEYLRLNEGDYLISDLSNNGEIITLIKIENFDTIVGKQIGMIAPSVSFTSIDGLAYQTDDLLIKKLIVANFSGCSRRSYNSYEALCKRLTKNYNIIGLESGIKSNIGGIIVDVNDSINQDIYLKYRNAYSNYDCYLVNEANRIIDKFTIFDWENTMKKYDKE